MWRKFNFKRDKRTFFNFVKLPAIIFLRIPYVLIYYLLEYTVEKMQVAYDYIPGGDT